MAKFVYLYTGGRMAETPQEQEKVMAEWTAWFGTLGAAVTDGGNPFADSLTVSSDGATTTGASSAATGYSIVESDSLEAAATQAKGCPVLAAGGSVEIYQALAM